MRWLALTVPLLGCAETFDVDVQGVLLDGWEGAAVGLPGATLETVALDGRVVDTTTSADNGWFRLAADPGQQNLVVVRGEGLMTASFQGNPGLNPRFRIPNGEIFGVRESAWEAERARWDGCPGLGERATLFGKLQIEGFVGGEDGELVAVQTGRAVLRLADGPVREPCYLDADGFYDPAATRTGPQAEVLFADLPAGGHLLEVTYEPIEDVEQTWVYEVYVLPDMLAPRVPLLVPFAPGGQ